MPACDDARSAGPVWWICHVFDSAGTQMSPANTALLASDREANNSMTRLQREIEAESERANCVIPFDLPS